MRPDLPFPQIATGDLDVAVVGQLPPPNVPFSDEFEPSPVKVIGFEAAFRRGRLTKQDLEDASGNAHHTLIFTDAYAEFEDRAFGAPPGVGRETKEYEPPEMFC
jgi:hypothetical protein